MAARPSKRRSASAEYHDADENDWAAGDQDRARSDDLNQSASSSQSMSRPRRPASAATYPSITVARAQSHSPDESKRSIRLTVKMPSNKLREATSGRKNVSLNSRDRFEPAEIVSGPRGSRAKRSIVVESGSEDEEEDEAEPSEADEEEDEDEDEEDEEEEEDAEGESDDGGLTEDVNMSDAAPPRPVIKMTGSSSKPSVTVTPAQEGKVKSVEAKEMETGEEEDDEELSELESDNPAAAADTGLEDAEGEEIGAEDEEMDQDEDSDSDGESPAPGSRDSTPDVSKMTKRQRSRIDQVVDGHFLQLPMEPQIKKHLTAEEHAMRRAEMARRRKNLSEKRNEEEKMDTINRLLKKQAPKRRGKISAAEANGAGATANTGEGTPQEMEVEKPNPTFVRWINNREGSRIGVPDEWLGTPVGRIFEGGGLNSTSRMVEEVEG